MMGYDDWNATGWQAHPHHPKFNGLTYLRFLPEEKQQEILTSPEWTRAIFVRYALFIFISIF
jgi:hypothetical protein